MKTELSETIFPCPLSRGYGIPAQQAWILLKVFLGYRLMLACSFMGLYYTRMSSTLFEIYYSRLFIYSSQSYLILSIVSAVCIGWRLTGYTIQAQLLIITDIIILTLFMHACGGINSGIGILLAVSIASGGLLIGGRCALFYAALASLAVLSEQIYVLYPDVIDPTRSDYVNAGMLGASFIIISLLSYFLAKRSEQMLQLTDQQQQTIANLEELNQYIIQHLQSGIIIINQQQVVQMANEAAMRLLNLNTVSTQLTNISKPLATAFQDWLHNKNQDVLVFKRPQQLDIHIRFMLLPTRHEFFYMINLEDISFYNQRLQQSKLASLGRLTASIAHEIRNPLSAISYSGQLLSETSYLSQGNQRLIEIIRANAKRVNAIIEDILQLSRRHNSRREKIVLNLWLENYASNFILENGMANNAFKLIFDEKLPSAFMDIGHLKQIMDNLCQNAFRYGKPELGAITLQTQTLKQAPCINVIDNGIGISHENTEHLFEPFFTTSVSGTGLGLYISKELAELNQATLSYHLTPENTCCFRICFLNADNILIEI